MIIIMLTLCGIKRSRIHPIILDASLHYIFAKVAFQQNGMQVAGVRLAPLP